MIEKLLEEIGLTKSESKTYLVLLNLKESTTGPISKQANVSSSKIYEVLQKLINKGLVTEYSEKNIKHFRVANPNRIKDYLESKKKKIEEEMNQIEEVLPGLEQIYKEGNDKETQVELFRGYEGVRSVFNDLLKDLKKGDELLVMGGGDRPSGNPKTKAFFENIHLRRSEKEVKLKIIFNDKRKGFFKQMTIFPHTEIKYIPFGTPSTTNIYKDTTVLLTMSPTPAAIRIQSKQITESYRKQFQEMWRQAKK
ncbi:hypothetical protein HN587_07155 [Candidatus Woesearchaeota archaeon]|jgi:HTH-type transcriptional regulator, sugar sensing transcriptional regulator|nr:hypothetical protein [Candidatus Woesearchaeota archaeon]